jgi:hypothetical protein
MIRRGSSRPCCVVPGCSWLWFSEPSLGGFLGVFSGPCSWGFDGGNLGEPFVVLWAVILLPNPWVKGLDFGIFGVLGLEEFLAGFLRLLLFGKFWWTKSWLWTPHEVFLSSPKSCSSPWSDSGDRGLDLVELTRGCCSSRAAQATPVWPVLLTGRPVWVTCGICLGWTAWLVCLWVLVLLVSSWSVWCCFVRCCVGFSFSAGCVLEVVLFQGLKKSLRLSGMLVVRLL